MKVITSQAIMRAMLPREIFTMNADSIKQEYDEYLERFGPAPYNSVQNLVITRKVTELYHKALRELSGESADDERECRTEMTVNEPKFHWSKWFNNYGMVPSNSW